MEDAYSGYEYHRFRRRKNHVFLIISVIALLIIVVFCANLIFGFVSLKKSSKAVIVNCPQVTFYINTSDEYSKKSDAILKATEIKSGGGSGYIFFDNDVWRVVNDISNEQSDGMMPISTPNASIDISDEDQKELFETVIGTFKTNFDILCGFCSQFEDGIITAEEVSNSSRAIYNQLVDLTGEIEILQTNSANQIYSTIMTYLTRQMFGLSLIWLDGTNENFSWVLKNASSWIIFAYLDLTNDFKK